MSGGRIIWLGGEIAALGSENAAKFTASSYRRYAALELSEERKDRAALLCR